jgi:pimeloyl-ACP methyl ester carboxylesterase
MLPPLTGTAELTPLVVPAYRDATVSVPLGARESRPVVLALHGNYDRPEWQCAVWREVTKGYPFILCPRGVPRRDASPSEDRWTYGKATDVRREIDAALGALRVRFGDYVAPAPIVYAGFSLGAILGVGIVAEDADRFPRAVLIEGGHAGWSQARAKTFAGAGGKRILFACGQSSCKSEARAPEKLLGRFGVETRSVFGGEVGHTYDGPVAAEIARALPWLIGDDPRWSMP